MARMSVEWSYKKTSNHYCFDWSRRSNCTLPFLIIDISSSFRCPWVVEASIFVWRIFRSENLSKTSSRRFCSVMSFESAFAYAYTSAWRPLSRSDFVACTQATTTRRIDGRRRLGIGKTKKRPSTSTLPPAHNIESQKWCDTTFRPLFHREVSTAVEVEPDEIRTQYEVVPPKFSEYDSR